MSKSSSTGSRRAGAPRRSYALIFILLLAVVCAVSYVTGADAQSGRSRRKKEAAQRGSDRPNVGKPAPGSNRRAPARPQDIADGKVHVRTADKFDVSPPLRTMTPIVTLAEEKDEDDPGPPGPVNDTRHDPDPLVQSSTGRGVFNGINVTAIPATGASFDGLFNPAPSPFTTGPVPPDPNGDIGPNHYVQMVNSQFQIFTRAGASVFGPANINTLFTGFGGPCQTENAGDPVVLYDQLADRWMLSQFTSAGPTYFNCVAISTTGDPTGSYYRYAIATGSASANFTDYPKYGVWPDAYYLSTREFFQNTTFSGNGAYALERAEMIKGNPAARVVSFILPPGGANDYRNGDGWLPSDLDGSRLPPAGSPNYFVGSMDNGGPYGAPADALNLFEFHVDWVTPANSTFTFTSQLNTAAFDSIFPCSGGSTPSRNCIPQPGTTTKIDILSYRQRPTFRLAYRNFGTHESLVTAQSVEATTAQAGMRWWEIRSPHTSPTIFQEGTYAPDTVQRWMGSVAMDHDGNAGLAYSVSDGTSVFPGIRYTGRLSTDTLGQMPQGEAVLVNGAGSQTSTSSRWGDYSSMNIDPNNDCSFWYTNEYYTITAARPWKTRIGFFRFPQCNVPAGSVISSGQLIISEFRLRGPNGPMDEFIELYNTLNTDLPVKTADGTGLAVVSSDAPTLAKCVVPEGTVIKARGHYLCADTASPSPGAAPAFSLSAYPSANDSSTSTTATPNANILSEIPDASGLALFSSTTAANFTLANRLDAAGFSALPAGSLFKEGNGINAISNTTPAGQYTFARKQPGGLPSDSGANENDFRFLDPELESFGATPQLGAAGPENMDSPVFGTGTIANSRIDTGACSTCGENAVRNNAAGDPLTSSQGTIDLRVKVTNNSGVDLTRLRFRVFEITTTPEAGVADVRAITSGPITVPLSAGGGGGTANVEGTTLETPPSQPNGGGYNSTLSLDSVTTGAPFLNGTSRNVRFLLGVKTTGVFRFAVAFEGLPKGGSAVSGGIYGLSRDTENLAASPTAATANISGSVTTPDGAPMPGVLMRLSGQKSAISFTDASGKYHFDNVEANNLYTITPALANYHLSPPSRSFSLLADKTDATFKATPDALATTNAIDMTENFIRQHYLDFLDREPEPAGLDYWTAQIDGCGLDASCIRSRRIGVSAAFFIEQEYQETGSFVYRLYKGALGRQVNYQEFAADRQQVIGGADLDARKAAFANAFVQRPDFVQKYNGATTAESFVDLLLQTVRGASGADLSGQRGALVARYNSGSSLLERRSLTVREAIEDASFKQAEYNKSFVLMQYFGYLKREPEQDGYNFWLNVLDNKEPGNYRGMVCSFITSAEYQKRFSPLVTHSNAECK